jgi:hypothetical protein
LLLLPQTFDIQVFNVYTIGRSGSVLQKQIPRHSDSTARFRIRLQRVSLFFFAWQALLSALMADESGVTLHITFRTPPSLQERQDFVQYLRAARETTQQKVYRYCQQQRSPRKVMLPLDFEEVVSVSVETP